MYLPQSGESNVILIKPDQFTGPNGEPVFSRSVSLTFRWPRVIRFGESASVRTVLMADSSDGSSSESFVPLPSFSEKYDIFVEAKIDVAGVRLDPPGIGIQALQQNRSTIFSWNLTPLSGGRYRGIVWISLRFVPHDGSLQVSRVIAAQTINFKVNSLAGLEAGQVKMISWGTLVIGIILSFPSMDHLIFGPRQKI
jgi:hypothetical protein